MSLLRRLLPLSGGGAIPWYLSGGITSGQCVSAFAAKGAATQAASYSNLNNPGTNDITVGVAPTWDATNGWKFNGSTQYLITANAPAAVTWSMICRFSNAAPTGAAFGIVSAFNGSPNRFYLAVDGTNHYYGNDGVRTVAGTLASGVMCVAGAQGYLNGSADGAAIATNVTPPNRAPYVGCSNANGTPGEFLVVYVQALAIYNVTLTAPQVAALTTAMNAL